VDRLPPDMFNRMLEVFEAAGLAWKGGPEARELLASLRATYEPLLDGLGRRLMLPLTEWIAADDAADHWQRGHRGLIASRLIEELSDRSARAAAKMPDAGKPSSRLRARLGRRQAD
jgi:hypothetical protein